MLMIRNIRLTIKYRIKIQIGDKSKKSHHFFLDIEVTKKIKLTTSDYYFDLCFQVKVETGRQNRDKEIEKKCLN